MAVDRAFNYHLNVFNNIEANYGTTLGTITTGTGTRTYTNSINYGTLASTIGSSFNRFGSNLSRSRVVLSVTGFHGTTVQDEFTRFSLATQITAIDGFSLMVLSYFNKRSPFITLIESYQSDFPLSVLISIVLSLQKNTQWNPW